MAPSWRTRIKQRHDHREVNKANRFNNIARGPRNGTGTKVVPPRCHVCMDLRPELWLALQPGTRSNVFHFKELTLAAKTGCQPCWFVAAAIERLVLRREGVTKSQAELADLAVTCEVPWQGHGAGVRGAGGPMRLVFAVPRFPDGEAAAAEGPFNHCSIHVIHVSTPFPPTRPSSGPVPPESRQPSPWPIIGPGRQVTARLHSRRRRAIIGGWLNNCRLHHAHCSDTVSFVVPEPPCADPHAGRGLRNQPKDVRMLRLGENPRTSMRLVEVNFTDVHDGMSYGIVSHFPEFAGPWRTTSGNLQAREQKFPWTDLPPAYQESLDTLRELGIGHVFMEELCVRQDDREECDLYDSWMAEICRSSQLTLMLTRVDDPRMSAFGRRHRTLDQLGRRSPAPSQENDEPGSDEDVIDSVEIKLSYKGILYPIYASLPMDGAHVSFQIDKTVLHKAQPAPANDGPRLQHLRSAYLAHRFLSTRVVHVHESELVWECMARTRCECGWLDAKRGTPSRRRDAVVPGPAKRRPHLTPATIRYALLPRHVYFPRPIPPSLAGAAAAAAVLGTVSDCNSNSVPDAARVARLLTYQLPRARDERLRAMAMLAPRLSPVSNPDLLHRRWLPYAVELGILVGDSTNFGLCTALLWRVRPISNPFDVARLPARLCCYNSYEHGHHGYASKGWDLQPKANVPTWSFLSLHLRDARIESTYGCSGPERDRYETASIAEIVGPGELFQSEGHEPLLGEPRYRLEITADVAECTIHGLLSELTASDARSRYPDIDGPPGEHNDDAGFVGRIDGARSPAWPTAVHDVLERRLRFNRLAYRNHPRLGLVRVFPDDSCYWMRSGKSSSSRCDRSVPHPPKSCPHTLGPLYRTGADGLIPSPSHEGCDCPGAKAPQPVPPELQTPAQQSGQGMPPFPDVTLPRGPTVPPLPPPPPGGPPMSESFVTPAHLAGPKMPSSLPGYPLVPPTLPPRVISTGEPPPAPPSPGMVPPRLSRPFERRRVLLLRLFVLDRRQHARPGATLEKDGWVRENLAFVDVGIVAVQAHHGDAASGELERIGVFDHARTVDDHDVFARNPKLTVKLI